MPLGRQHGPRLVLLNHIGAGACLCQTQNPVGVPSDAREDAGGALRDLASTHGPDIVLAQVLTLVESTQEGWQLREGHIGLFYD